MPDLKKVFMNPVEKGRSFFQGFSIVFWAVILVAIFRAFVVPIEMEDGWWHLSAGRWMAEHRQVPREDVFSFTDERGPWQLTQWLGSAIFYGVYQIGDVPGLIVFRAVFFTLIFAVFVGYAYHKKTPLPLLIVLIFLLFHALESRNLLRPLIFNLIFISVFLMLLYSHQKTGDPRRLFLLPVLGIFWANLHLGSFVYGHVIFAAFFISAMLEHLFARRQGNAATARREAQHARDLGLIWCAYLFVFFINPYGAEGFLYPFKVFLLPEFINFYKFKGIVDEMGSPLQMYGGPAWIPFLVLIVMVLHAVGKSEKRNWASMVLFGAALGLFLASVRAVDFFALTSGYIILASMPAGVPQSLRPPGSSRVNEMILMGVIILALGFCALNPSNPWTAHCSRQKKDFIRMGDAAAAVEFLKKKNIRGSVFNDEHFGGYLIWSAYPQLRAFVDGRQADQEKFQLYLAVLQRPEEFWEKADSHNQFDLILLDPRLAHSKKMIRYLARQPQWRMVFHDGNAVVYVRYGLGA